MRKFDPFSRNGKQFERISVGVAADWDRGGGTAGVNKAAPVSDKTSSAQFCFDYSLEGFLFSQLMRPDIEIFGSP